MMDDGARETAQQRDVVTQRVRVGLSGLAAVFLLTLLAASIFSFLGQDDPHATKLANGAVVANSADPEDDTPKEPLAELGVAPGANLPKPDANTPVVTIPAPPAPQLDAQGRVIAPAPATGRPAAQTAPGQPASRSNPTH